MISITTAMLVGLGFLIASLLAVLLTPAYRARTVRLTSERVRAQLPTTEQELKADKDRIRADNALRVHKLESQLERFKFSAARQMVEVGRRDGEINQLTSSLENLTAELEVALNARNVLEQTIADRLPKVEQRLIEAKKLLFQRDREIAALTEDAARTQRALVEAVQINAQQRAEVERLTIVLETRAGQSRNEPADPDFDADVAMRAELGALRARSRDQAGVIDRLQAGGEEAVSSGAAAQSVPEVVRLQRDLLRAESALKSLKDLAAAGQVDQVRIDGELRERDQRLEDQAQQIASLAAALRTYEEDSTAERAGSSIRDSRIAMKSRLSALQAQTESQSDLIRKLRAEVASSNERLARQAQHFMEEMRRLGAGTLPASAQVRRPQAAAVRRSLTQRITEAKPEMAVSVSNAKRPVLVKSDSFAAAPKPTPEARPAAIAVASETEVLALGYEPGASEKDMPPAPSTEDTPESVGTPEANRPDEGGTDNGSLPASPVEENVVAEPAASAAGRAVTLPRPRLLDRINEYGKG